MALDKFKSPEIKPEVIATLDKLLTIIVEQKMFEGNHHRAIIKLLLLNPSARMDRLAEKLRNLQSIIDKHEDLRSIVAYSIAMAEKDAAEIEAGLKLFDELKTFEELEAEAKEGETGDEGEV